MRQVIVFMLAVIAINQNTFAGSGHETGHGGDALLVVAKEYPNKEQLSNAVELGLKALQTSGYLDAVTIPAIDELQSLKAGNKFLYVDDSLFVGINRFEGDYSKLVTLGALTLNRKGSFVFLAKKVLDYSSEKLAEVLMHDVLHHTLPSRMAETESFIEQLSRDLISNQMAPKLNANLILAYDLKNIVCTHYQSPDQDPAFRMTFEPTGEGSEVHVKISQRFDSSVTNETYWVDIIDTLKTVRDNDANYTILSETRPHKDTFIVEKPLPDWNKSKNENGTAYLSNGDLDIGNTLKFNCEKLKND